MKVYVITEPRSLRGIYETWPACRAAKDGVKGVICQQVASRGVAEAMLRGEGVVLPRGMWAFTDGNSAGGVGVVLVEQGSEEVLSVHETSTSVDRVFVGAGVPGLEATQDVVEALGKVKNVFAELAGLYEVLSQIPRESAFTLVHDYEGVGAWMEGRWKTKNPTVAAVVGACLRLREERRLTDRYQHQYGHQSTWAGRDDFARWNARADELASEGSAALALADSDRHVTIRGGARENNLSGLSDRIADVLDGRADPGVVGMLPPSSRSGFTVATVSAVTQRVGPRRKPELERLGATLLDALEEERVIAYLSSEVAEERAAAVELLAVMGSGGARVALTRVSQDDVLFVRNRAREALDSIRERKRERKRERGKEKTAELKRNSAEKRPRKTEWRLANLRTAAVCDKCGRDIPVGAASLHVKGEKRYFHLTCQSSAAERQANLARAAANTRIVQGGLPTLGKRR